MCRISIASVIQNFVLKTTLDIVLHAFSIICSAFANVSALCVTTEVDECLYKLDKCEASRINTPGSYKCSCPYGQVLASDGYGCIQCANDTSGTNYTAIQPPRVIDVNENLIQNSQAVKKQCGPQKGYGEKRCEIQGGGQEMAVMVG